VAVSLLPAAKSSFAGSATWKAAPATGDWNTATNWTPATVPNSSTDTATFATSNLTGVALSSVISVNGIVFNSGASAFTITDNAFAFTISGTGIMNNSAATQNFVIGVNGVGGSGTLTFSNSATAGTAIVSTAGPAPSGGNSGIVNFHNFSTADRATLINNGSSVAGLVGGTTAFWDTSSAGTSTIANYGGGGTGQGGGVTLFIGSATAAGATLICSEGAGGVGASVQFKQDTTGGTARLELFGNGQLQISEHNLPGLTTGSIEGSGEVFLGSNNLTLGANNLSTAFSGIIQDGDEGTGGSLTKIGTGTLTINGPNTYTGPTTITAGTLSVRNKRGLGTGTGPVNVNAGTLGGTGTIAGSVTLGTGSGAGAFLAPGVNATPGTLTIQGALTFNSDSTYNVNLKTTKGTMDKVVANGVTIASNAHVSLNAAGHVALPPGTTFTVIDNTAATAIAGELSNLPNGATITAGGNTFQASYQGGDGNNLTLTVIP